MPQAKRILPWTLLLVPPAYLCLDLFFGTLSWVMGTTCDGGMLGFFLLRIMPILAPVLMGVAWACRKRIDRVLLAVFLVGMALAWAIDLWALDSFISWGVSFHHGDLLE